jgi:hypothetical protein
LDGIVTVTDSDRAGARLAAEGWLVVEPSGALSIAAMVFHAAGRLTSRPARAALSSPSCRAVTWIGSLPGPGSPILPVGRASGRRAARPSERASGREAIRREPLRRQPLG